MWDRAAFTVLPPVQLLDNHCADHRTLMVYDALERGDHVATPAEARQMLR